MPVALSSIHCILAQLLLNTQQLVVLGVPLAAAGCTRLDLTSGQAHSQVSDEAVLRLTRPATVGTQTNTDLGEGFEFVGRFHGTMQAVGKT